MSREYTSKEKRAKKLKYAAVLLAVIFVFSSVLLLVNIWETRQSVFPIGENAIAGSDISLNGKNYHLKENIETVLVLGLDKFETENPESYNNDKQADFLMLLVADHDSKTVTALHINRDTIANMNILGVAGDTVGTVKKQIALAHTYGNGKEMSCRNTAEAVSDMLMGIQVDHYVSVTMDAVPVYNDFVGGVEVTVLDDFSGIDGTLVEGETVTLFGEHALNYVRTRYGLDDSSNSARMVRQRQYLEALYRKTLACMKTDASFVINAGIQLAEYIVSDYTGNGLQELAERISDYRFTEICEIEGRNIRGEKHMEFYPSEKSIKETVVKIFYEPKNK